MKASLPQGTRDFGAVVIKKRQYIANTIKNVFELYGFEALETPAFENYETLMGKYGDEGDQLIFKILNNGLHEPSKIEKTKKVVEELYLGKNSTALTDRALKYDLTIPFARYVAMNVGQLSFPFKRYQIQPVWRADRPQRGRYREFYQCDADIIGSNNLFNEVELANIYTNVFNQLKIPVSICINNRKLLAGLAQLCGNDNLLIPITVAIDKLDKIGIEKVKIELQQRGIHDEQIKFIDTYLNISTLKNNDEILKALSSLFQENEEANKGIEELKEVVLLCPHLQIDVTLARGLNYYTGTIYEVKPTTVSMGSIGGGGRYDNLTGMFDVPNMPGVGISFGLDRIYDVIEELNLFPTDLAKGCTLLFLYNENNTAILNTLATVRNKQIACEMYPDNVKIDKQYKYAEKKNIPFVATYITDDNIVLKNILSGEKVEVTLDTITSHLA
jgi:histidyl-tRNA synthetase